MAEYRIRNTGEIVFDLARAFPDKSIPVLPSHGDLDALGVDPVFEAPQPVTGRYQFAYRDGVEMIDGTWVKKYSVGPSADDEPAYRDEIDSRQAEQIRSERQIRLEASDWTQVSDAPVDKSAWAIYRQALRDLPSQPGFPWDITWPTPPV